MLLCYCYSCVPNFQVNFLASQLCALVIGYFYRVYLGPHKTSPTVRHVIQILIGVPLTYFCFGRFEVVSHYSLVESLILLFLELIY